MITTSDAFSTLSRSAATFSVRSSKVCSISTRVASNMEISARPISSSTELSGSKSLISAWLLRCLEQVACACPRGNALWRQRFMRTVGRARGRKSTCSPSESSSFACVPGFIPSSKRYSQIQSTVWWRMSRWPSCSGCSTRTGLERDFTPNSSNNLSLVCCILTQCSAPRSPTCSATRGFVMRVVRLRQRLNNFSMIVDPRIT